MHGFVSDYYSSNFFNFLYAFYRIDLDRDISRLDRDTMNELISIIKRNDNTGRTYFLVEHTADAVRINERGAKTRIRHYLKLIDRAFWEDSLPQNSKNRLLMRFLDWASSEEYFIQDRERNGGKGKKGKKSFSSPYIKYLGNSGRFQLILPPQIIRFHEFSNLFWRVESENLTRDIEIIPYAQGVTGYKTDQEEIDLPYSALFDSIIITIEDENTRYKSFRIAKDEIRFFDSDMELLSNDSIPKGRVYSFTRKGFVPESEAIIESFPYGNLLRTVYELVKGDIIRIPDGKPIVVGGKLNEGLLPRGMVEGVVANENDKEICVYKDAPSLFFKMNPKAIKGTALRINNKVFRIYNEGRFVKGVSEFELMDRSDDKGYCINLLDFGCASDGKYEIVIDVPNGIYRKYSFVYIKGLKYEFEDAPYIFNTRGTLCVPKYYDFKPTDDCNMEIQDKKRFDFDIEPGKGFVFLIYKGIRVGFEIPAFSYQFHNENWMTGPHTDIWHGDFEPRISITYNADNIKFFLDEIGEDDDDEHFAKFEKNKGKGIFECDLNRFKSWFGRERDYRQIYLELPEVQDPIEFVKVITKSKLRSSLLKADFENNRLIGEFDIIGNSSYYADIIFEDHMIVEKAELKDKNRLEVDSDLRTGSYVVKIFEKEEDDFGFDEPLYFEIGSKNLELLNPYDLGGKSVRITRLHMIGDETGYLPLKHRYRIVDLEKQSENENVYIGKMIVGDNRLIVATFSVQVEFFDLERIQAAYITYPEEDYNVEFLYDEQNKTIVKNEDKRISKSQAYRRYKTSLYPGDYVFELEFIRRPADADVTKDDTRYNNLEETYKGIDIDLVSVFKKR